MAHARSRLPLAGLGLLLVAAATWGGAAAAVPAVTVSHFIQVSAPANILGDSTYLSSQATDGHPRALVFVTENYTPSGTCCGGGDDVAPGVWYDATANQWAIFNQSTDSMASNIAYNVVALSAPTANAFVVTATASNTSGSSVYINSSKTNALPGARLQVTQNWNPNGAASGVYNNHTIGVRYDTTRQRWAIVEEDGSAMPSGASFNVMVGSAGTGGTVALQRVTSTNLDTYLTSINNSHVNGFPNAVILVTPDYNPGGRCACHYDLDVTGVSYASSRWSVMNMGGDTLQLGTAFDLLLFSS